MIYLDNAATTKPCVECIDAMNDVLQNDFYNPSSLYNPSVALKKRIDSARAQLASLLNIEAQALYFTSGATESNNFAIFCGNRNKKGNMVVTDGEHASVFSPVSTLKNKGTDVRFAPLSKDGTVNVDALLELIDDNTSFVSVIHRSNETGAVNDIEKISKEVKERNKDIVFHSDGVQFFGKSGYGNILSDVDIYSISAHKVSGAKGVGAVYIRRGLSLPPYIYGGGQERDVRSGTENTHAIIGFAAAAKAYCERFRQFDVKKLNSYAVKTLSDAIKAVKINTSDENSSILSVSIEGVNAEIMQRLLCGEDVLIGLGSACASKLKYNRVLANMGLSRLQIAGSIRLSFSPENTFEEIKYACEKIIEITVKLRSQNVG